ncbi:MAG: thioredoxin domain-containing protein [Vampirovibrionales bacterium]|nr:thioredoxin domain-containing protein [Vampirovibrionales bacterium]
MQIFHRDTHRLLSFIALAIAGILAVNLSHFAASSVLAATSAPATQQNASQNSKKAAAKTLQGIKPAAPKSVLVALPQAKSNPVVLMFKTQFCSDCKHLKPKLEALQKAKHPKVTLVFVDINRDKTPQAQKLMALFKPITVPTTVFIQPGGQLAASFVGDLAPAQLTQAFNALPAVR